MKYFKIEWLGAVGVTIASWGSIRPGMIPCGGTYLRSREMAEKRLDRFLAKCGPFRAEIVQKHKPRIIELETA